MEDDKKDIILKVLELYEGVEVGDTLSSLIDCLETFTMSVMFDIRTKTDRATALKIRPKLFELISMKFATLQARIIDDEFLDSMWDSWIEYNRINGNEEPEFKILED